MPHRLKQIAAALLIILALLPFLRWAAFNRMDDFLITLRFARNAAEGVGAVFTEGYRFQGFTSPLQFCVGTFVCLFQPGLEFPPTFFCLLGLTALAGFALNLSLWVTRRLSLAALAVCLGAVLSSQLLLAYVGFDIMWALGLTATALTLHWRERPLGAGILAGLAILARPDAAVFAGLMGLVLLARRDWRGLMRFSLPVAIILVPWLVFATLYYGSPLPGTMAAKQVLGSSDNPRLSQTLAEAFEIPFRWFPLNEGIFHTAGLIIFILAFNLSLTRWFPALRRENLRTTCTRVAGHPLFLFASGAVLHYLVYFQMLRVPATFPWYHAYAVGLLLALYAAPAAWIAGWAEGCLGEWRAGRRTMWRTLSPSLIGLLVIAGAAATAWEHQAHRTPKMNPERYRYAGYRGAAEWLNNNSRPDDRISATEVGVLGWYCDRPILDSANVAMEGITPRDDFRFAVRPIRPGVPPPANLRTHFMPRVFFRGDKPSVQIGIFERNPYPTEE